MHAKRAASVLVAICLAAGQLCSAAPAAPAAKAGAKGQFIFQYKSMPYVDVVRRFAQALKRPLIGDLNIEGELTFFDAEPYTRDEALDTLNLLLSMRGYRLIERGRYLQLIPLSEVPGTTGKLHTDVDAVKGERPGKVVTVLLPVKHMVAKDAAKLVVRKVSPFGSISPMPRGKGIIITDTVANIRRIRDFLGVFDTEEHTGRQMKTITLKHAMATDIARTIDNIFGARAAVIRKYGEYRSGRARPPVDPREVVNALADARTNMLFLTGVGEQLAHAEKLIKSIDTEKESSNLRIFQLKKARAAKLAKTLNAVMPKRTITYGRGAYVRTKSVPIAQVVPDEGSNRLIVYAPPDQMPRIEKLIKEFDMDVRGFGGASIFKLKFADARQLSRVISGATGRTDSRGRVRSRLSVGYDTRTNTLVLSGPPEDLDIAAKVIEELDQKIPEDRVAREIHVVHIEAGDARGLARSLVRLFRQSTSSRSGDPGSLRVEADRQTNNLIISAAVGDWPTVQKILKDLQAAAAPLGTSVTRRVPLKFAKADELYRSLRQIYSSRSRSSRSRAAGVPVVISPSSRDNSLLISASEADHKTIAALIKSMDVDTATAADPIHIVYLKSAEAQKIVAMLKAMQPRVSRGRNPDVFIQADPVTNAVILRAPQSKRKMLETMVAKLDAATQREARELRTIPLKHAPASTMVSILSQLYGRYVSGGRRSRSGVDPAAQIILTAGPANKTLLVEAPKSKIEQIALLVAKMDQEKTAAVRQVRTYQLGSSDAREVARSLSRLFAADRRRRGAADGDPAPRFEVDGTTNQLLIAATDSQFLAIEKLIEKIKAATVLTSSTETFVLKFAKANDIVGVLSSMLMGDSRSRRSRSGPTVRVAAMLNRNAILVQGPPDKIALAKDLIAKFDVKTAAEAAVIRVFKLKNADADSLVRTLRGMLPRPRRGETRKVLIQADRATNSVLLTAPRERRKELATLIEELDKKTEGQARETTIIKLKNASAATLRSIMTQMFPNPRSRRRGASGLDERVIITAAPDDRSLVVDAPRQKIEKIAALAKSLDNPEATGGLDVRTYDVTGGSASEMARYLSRLFGRQSGRRRTTGGEPQPRFEADNTANQLLVAATKTQFERIDPVIEKIKKTVLATETRTYPLKFARADTVLGLLQSMLTGDTGRRSRRGRPSSASLRMATVPGVNAIVVQATPQKHTAVKALLATFDKRDMTGDAQVRIIKLANAKAEELATTLRAMLPRQPRGRPREVIIEPDRVTNTILLRAPKAQSEIIEGLIAKLDAERKLVARETRIIKLPQGGARSMASMVTQLYPSAGGNRRGRRRSAPSDDPQAVVAIPAPDDRSMVIEAPRDRMVEIAKLIESLATEAPGALQIRTYTLKSGDAAELARSLARLFAQRSRGRGAVGQVQARFEADRAANRLMVAATVAQFEQIEALIKDAQKAELASKTETYVLKHARATEIVGVLQSMLTGTSSRRRRGSGSGQVRVASLASANAIVVQGPPDKQELAKQLIATFDTPAGAQDSIFRIVTLNNAKAVDLANTLRRMLPRRGRGQQQVSIQADQASNSILLRGAPAERKTIEEMIAKLDGQAKVAREIRIVRLVHASASALEPMLSQLYGTGGGSSRRGRRRPAGDDPARVVITPAPDDRSLVIDAPRDKIEPIATMAKTMDQRGAITPVVRTYQLKKADASQVARSLSRLFAPSRSKRPAAGEIRARFEADTSTNQVLVSAAEAQFPEIEKLLKGLEEAGAAATQTRTYPLKFAKATEILDVLQTMVSGAVRGRRGRSTGQEVRLAADAGNNAIIVQGAPEKHALAVELIKTLDTERAGTRGAVQIVKLKNAQAQTLAKSLATALAKRGGRTRSAEQQVTVTAETNSNSILLRGPAADLAEAVEMIKKLDADSDSLGVQVRIFRLESSDAVEMSQTIGKLFGDMIRQAQRGQRGGQAPPFSVAADERSNALIVSTGPAYFALIEGLLADLDKAPDRPTRDMRYVTLRSADATDVADKLTAMYANVPKKDRPVIESDFYANAITIIGKTEHIKEMEAIIEKMDPEDLSRQVRVVPLTKVRAEQMAEVIQRIYGQTHGKDIRVTDKIPPRGQKIKLPNPADALFPAVAPDREDEQPKPKAKAPEKVEKPEKKAQAEDVPITIAVDRAANALIISGTRTEIENIEYLIDSLSDSYLMAEAEFRSFKVIHADPESVARTLDTLFNPKQRRTPQPAKGKKGKAAPAAPLPPPVISVVADTRTSTVIVRAKPVDFQVIESLIQLLDKEAKTISEIRVFVLENTDATAVAANLRELFQGQTTRSAPAPKKDKSAKKAPTPQQRRVNMVRQLIEVRRKGGGVAQVDTRTVVSISANRQTNSVIVTAPADAMELIKKIIGELDQSGEGTVGIVRMYPLKHAEVRPTVTVLKELFAPTRRAGGRSGRSSTPAALETPVIITADEAAKLIIVSAPAEKHKLVGETLAKIEEAAEVGGEVSVQVYKVEHADAASVATSLSTTLSKSGSAGGRRGRGGQEALRISADRSSNSLVVRATKEDHTRIVELLAKVDQAPASQRHPVRVVPLNNVDAGEVAKALNRVFASPSSGGGRRRTTTAQKVIIEASRDSRMLMVRADDETFEKIRALAGQLDARPAGPGVPTIIALKTARASTIAAALTQAFRIPRGVRAKPSDLVTVVAEPVSNSIIVTASEANLKKVQDLVAKFDAEGGGRRTEFIVLKHAQAAEIASVLAGIAGGGSSRRPRRGVATADGVNVSSDTASNAVILSGPGPEVDKLVALALQLDGAAATVKPVVKMYPVRNADIPTMVTVLQQIFAQGTSSGRRRPRGTTAQAPVTIIGDEGAKKLIVSAPAAKHELIAQIVKDFDEAEGDAMTVQVYRIENADAAGMAKALGETLGLGRTGGRRGSTASPQAVRISADRGSNTLLVRAGKEDHERIAKYIKEMDVAVASRHPVRMIPLNAADADNVAKVLKRVFLSSKRTRGQQNIIIEGDSDSRKIMVSADDETFAKIRELAAQMDTAPATAGTQRVFALKVAQADSVSRALTQIFRARRGERVRPSDLVTVAAEPASNTLIVTANDEKMKRVQEMIKQLDKKSEGGVRVEMILLKNARAEDLAKVLSRVNVGAGGRGRAKLTISAEPTSNALIVAGPAGEMDEIMKMAMQLDQQPSRGATGVYVLALEKSDATDMARMVQDIYNQQAKMARQEKRSMAPLAVSSDSRANALVLATTKEMYERVSGWVGDIEKIQPRPGRTRMILLEHADPAEVQKAIDQLFGGGGSSKIQTGPRGPRGARKPAGRSGGGKVDTTILDKQRAIMISASEEDYQVVLELVKKMEEAAIKKKHKIRVFALKHAANARVAAAISSVYRGVRGARPEDQVTVTALPQTTAVIVSATPEKMEEVAHLIEQLDKEEIAPDMEHRIYPLTHAQPTKILPILRSMFARLKDVRPDENIDVQADERTRSIIVTAKGTIFKQIEKIIKVVDRKPAFEGADVLIVPLKYADAASLARVLNEMLRPSATGQVTREALALQEQIRLLRVRSTIKDKLPDLDLTKPIKVTADPARPQGSNSLIITSTASNLKAMRAVVEMLDVVPLAAGARVRIVRLKNADALSILAVLKDVFTQGVRLAGKAGTTVAGRAEPESESGRALTSPLNLSADMRTNTLILSGREETLALAALVIRDLDRDSGKIVTEVRLFRLKHADATKLVPMLQAVFAEGSAAPGAEGLRTQVTRLRTVIGGKRGKSSALPKARSALTIQADASTNILIVAARSDIMPLVADVVESMDLPGAGSMNTVRIFPLNNADATRIEQVISRLYAGAAAKLIRDEDKPTIAVDSRTNALIVAGSNKTFAVITALVARLDVRTRIELHGLRLVALKNADAATLAPIIQKMMDARVQRQKALGSKDAEAIRALVVADARSNSLIVGGSKDSFEVVSALAGRLDVASPALGGRIQIFTLKLANAGSIASTLGRLFTERYQAARTPDLKRQKPIVLPDLRTNSLLVAANPDDTAIIKSLLAKMDVKLVDPTVQLVVLPLKHNDAGIIGPTIRTIFQARLASMTAKGETPEPQDKVDVATDALSNSLIISASKENLSLIRGLLAKVDVEPPTETGLVRMYTLKNADAQRIATMLQSLLSDGLYKPGAAAGASAAIKAREKVAVAVDTRTNVLIVSASKENFAVVEQIIKRLDATADYGLYGDMKIYTLKHADATRLAPTLQRIFQAKRAAEAATGAGRSLAVSVIPDARTNSLLVTGSRESFKAMDAMIARLDAKEVLAETEFRVFTLTNATAAKVQDTLAKLFTQRTGRDARKSAVTIIADSRANSLIVGATSDDMKLAGSLVSQLDQAAKEPGKAMRVFPLKRADAAQVSVTLRDLYKAQAGTTAPGVVISVDERINAVVAVGGESAARRSSSTSPS